MIFHVSMPKAQGDPRCARAGAEVFAETARNISFSPPPIFEKVRKAPNGCAARHAPAPPTRKRCGRRWRSATPRVCPITPFLLTKTGNCAPGLSEFKQVANGLPLSKSGTAAVRRHGFQGGLGIEKFVDLTATAPAKIYNLIAQGLRLRSAPMRLGSGTRVRKVTLSDEMMHDLTGYTPFAGRRLLAGRHRAILVASSS